MAKHERNPPAWPKARYALILTLLALAAFSVMRIAPPVAGQQSKPVSLGDQARAALAQTSGELKLRGLEQPVEVLRDPWGVPHIYAKTQHDLFFAQGFVAAQDRLWQLDLWRRKAEGKLAEVFGPEFVERDRTARLLRYRGDWNAEWQSYSPDAKQIIEAFVEGINAYIEQTGDRLPVEFQLLGMRPGKWTPEVCVSRLAAYPLAGNADDELLRAEMVRALGPERAALLFPTDPPRPLTPPAGLDLEGVDSSVLAGVEAAGGAVNLPAGGSNNWAISGSRTASHKPILANDPHRALLVPSLRYIVHLVGPGWDVIGAGEPALPGISIGHNSRIAFGLTVFPADQQDIVVLKTLAEDSNRFAGSSASPGAPSVAMQIFEEEIRVRGEPAPRKVQLKYALGSPVIFEDAARHRAYLLHWVGDEPGTAGYLAGIAISRARNWTEFRAALKRWKLPSENFVYADIEGNIGYQAAALVPDRKGYDGLLPIPYSGETGWRGFFSLDDLPHEFNPARGFSATANNKTISPDEKRAIGFDWSSPYRVERIREVLTAAQKHTVEDSQKLQADVVSLAARELKELLAYVPAGPEPRTRAVKLLREWDSRMAADSAAAALYSVWLERLRERVFLPHVPADLWRRASRNITLPTLLAVLKDPQNPLCGYDCRSDALGASLDEAIGELERRLGPDWLQWRWGRLHTVTFAHPLAAPGKPASQFSRGPIERGGDGNTVNATSGANFRQTSGASYRQVLDLADWDHSVACNTPGQSGQPSSAHYDDLLPLWKDDRYFPLLYTRPAVTKAAKQRLLLSPQ